MATLAEDPRFQRLRDIEYRRLKVEALDAEHERRRGTVEPDYQIVGIRLGDRLVDFGEAFAIASLKSIDSLRLELTTAHRDDLVQSVLRHIDELHTSYSRELNDHVLEAKYLFQRDPDRRLGFQALNDALQHVRRAVEDRVDQVYLVREAASRGRKDVLSATPPSGVSIFVSHSSADLALVEAFVHLIEKALKVRAADIRCTSLDGYALQTGASTDDQLRDEIFSSRAFVAVLTPNSLASRYTLFEIGARWGQRLHVAPLVANGIRPSDLGAPLTSLHAKTLAERKKVQAALADLSKTLGLELEPAESYDDFIGKVSSLAQPPPPSVSGLGPARRPRTQEDEVVALTGWIAKHGVQMAHPIDFADLDGELGLSAGASKANLQRLAEEMGWDTWKAGPNSILFKWRIRPSEEDERPY